MKKILAFVTLITLLISTVTAYGALPEFMTKDCNNYTAAYSISFSFENCDQVIDAVEAGIGENEFLEIVDLKSILKDVFSQTSTIDLRADISADFKKIKVGMSSRNFSDVDVSENMNIKLDLKSGMWLNMDFAADEPVFEVIAVYPYSNKYHYINVMETISPEEREEMAAFADYFFNKEFINGIKKPILDLVEKHAEVTLSGSTCVVKLDNDGLIAILDQLFHNVWEFSNRLMIANSTEEVVYDGPDFTGVRILGEKGLTCTISLSGGNPTKIETVADFSMNVFKDAPLPDGSMVPDVKFTVRETAVLTDINSTVVTFPSLTDENSIDITYRYKSSYPEEEYEYEYPYWSVHTYTPSSVAVNNRFYVPLRDVLEYAYDDTVKLSYSNGVITATSENFPGFKTLTLTVGSDTAYTDGVAHRIGTVLIEDGVTYVSCVLFEDCFGWTLNNATQDMLTGDCRFNFHTKKLDEWI